MYDLTTITYPDDTTESFVYDAYGNLTLRTDRAGQEWSFTYNARGQVLNATNPDDGVTTFTYDDDGTLASRIDDSGNITTFGYDTQRRLILITHHDTTTRKFTYDNNNNLLTVEDERGNTTTFTYDKNNNLATLTDRAGNTTTFTYDLMDRLVSVTDRLDNSATRTYDELGRLKTVTDRSGNTITFSYDARGWLTSITEGGDKVWSRTNDDENIIAAATNPLSNTTSFGSDKMGHITRITSPLDNVTNITRDPMGLVTTVQNPLGNTTTRSYDSRGLLTGITRSTISASYTRNALGQITRVTDPNSNEWLRTYDSHGRLTSTADPLDNTASYSYDNRNRIDQVTLPGSLGTLDFTYDSTGNITRRLYSDSTDLNYTYDAAGRLTAADGIALGYDANGRITNSNGLDITRDALERIETITLGTGKTVTYTYDARNLLTQVTDWLDGITTFSYDGARRLATITRPNGITTTYTYDNEGRITGITEGAISSIALTRDANGQTTAATRNVPQAAPIATASTDTLTYDDASQVETFTYDALGRLTNDGTRTYTWNLATRLTGYTEGATSVTFTYDAFGNRVSRTEGGTTRNYVWNYAFGLPSISVVQEGGSDLRYYVHTPGGILLYSIEADDSRRDYHYDEMGNTLALSDVGGTVIDSYVYSPYGTLLGYTGSADNPFTWQGQYGVMREGESGLYYMRARYYDSKTARFISRDPVKTIGPRSINPYQYAIGNPMHYVDPSGQEYWAQALARLLGLERGGGEWETDFNFSGETTTYEQSGIESVVDHLQPIMVEFGPVEWSYVQKWSKVQQDADFTTPQPPPTTNRNANIVKPLLLEWQDPVRDASMSAQQQAVVQPFFVSPWPWGADPGPDIERRREQEEAERQQREWLYGYN